MFWAERSRRWWPIRRRWRPFIACRWRTSTVPGNPLRDPLVHFALLDFTVYAPTAAMLLQFRELALRGRHVMVSHEEQPRFAWR